MDNKKSDLTNPVFAKNARAENSSELSSIMEEMKNGIDLQPLEDIEQNEIIAFDDKSVIEEKEKADNASDKNNLIRKRFVRVIIAVIAVIAIVFGGYTAFVRLEDYSHAAAAVYQKGSSYYVSLDNDKKIELSGIIKAQLSSDGSVLIYSQDTSSKTGKYDIRMLELKKRSSVRSGGSLIVSGIESEWSTNSDCTYVYYTETKGNDTHYYAYSLLSRETYSITYDADQVFLPEKGDIVYFFIGVDFSFLINDGGGACFGKVRNIFKLYSACKLFVLFAVVYFDLVFSRNCNSEVERIKSFTDFVTNKLLIIFFHSGFIRILVNDCAPDEESPCFKILAFVGLAHNCVRICVGVIYKISPVKLCRGFDEIIQIAAD